MKIYQVDAFTDEIFKGNPAGVCMLSEFKDDSWMQNLAGEMNLSETAFIYKQNDGYHLRWFTPEEEVDLCGHATLASAHILWESGELREDETARFHTRSGLLTAEKENEWIQLKFPIEKEAPVEAPEGLIDALGITPEYIGKNRFDYVVEVDSEKAVAELNPDFNLLKEIETRGIIITSSSNSERYDFVSRFFAPRIGVNEDPVTGSAHTCLGYFWKERLGKSKFLARQLSQRGGIINVQVSEEDNSMYLGGQAVTVFNGELAG